MFEKTPSNRKPEAYAPCGGLIEDDGFVTVYPDLYKNETPAPQATDFSPLCANPSGVNPAF
ncbi:hypothetical protein ACGYLO_17580 [Sulfitobacter sp. 1A13353]|uniref:hypothetical protein n=1 Tax=Sulfitobacter sp. 1A13353 TaxID=3368568 RepID=UPI003745AC94